MTRGGVSVPGTQRRTGISRRALLAAGVAVGLTVAGGLPRAGAAPAGAPTLSGPLVRLERLAPLPVPHGARPLGAVAASQEIGIDFVFAPSDPAAVSSLLSSLYEPGSPTFHRWLAAGQFDSEFGPSPSEVSSLDGWLRSVGLDPDPLSGLIVHVSAPAERVSSALSVHIDRYALSGRDVYAAGSPPELPAGLSSLLTAVEGLDDVAQMRPLLSTGDGGAGAVPSASPGTGPVPEIAQPPAGVGDEYGIGNLEAEGFSGSGQTIAVYELAAHSPVDVSQFEEEYGLDNPVETVRVDGGAEFDYAGGGTEEADLDIEDALSQAPGAAVDSYEGPSTGSGPLDVYAAIVNDDTAKVVTTSWGACETDYGSTPDALAPYHELFEQAATQGQAVIAAAGDSGSEDCFDTDGTEQLSVDYPGSDPYVTDVGGTTLGSPDTVWNDCFDVGSDRCADAGGGAGGGGMSVMFAKPSWQDSIDGFTWATDDQACGTSCRGVPDVAVDANPSTGYRIFYDDRNTVVGGTSAAAPLVAGIDADVADSCTTSTGDLAPDLYAYDEDASSEGGLYGVAFSPVVEGDNDLTNTNGGDYPAGSGYSLAAGIGTPIASGWACPEVTGVTPSSAPAGSQVTVSGTNLTDASIFFGTASATVASASATEVTVTVPDVAAGAVVLDASSAMGTGASSVPFTVSPPASTGGHGTGAGGYWLLDSAGSVFPFGSAASLGSAQFPSGQGMAVSVAALPGGGGYWVVSADADVQSFGSAGTYGLDGAPFGSVVGISSTSDGRGYWVATSTGQVLTAGDATSYGSPAASGLHLAAPIVNMVPTPDGRGYWLLGADGGVFSYGDAGFYGSTGGIRLDAPAVAMAPTADGKGYWFVASDGGVFTFGDARFYGSTGGRPLDKPVIGLVVTADGAGYWLVASDGGVFTFGDAPFLGSLGADPPTSPVVAMAGA